ncbi:hypothetical protein [Nitrosospira briensis]|uniref:hypothetical protein n=1 Tax=Nitrosospira briensis TaxID=35799 RepID=UPI0012E11652|nr:hypothetical protein [Nitrosospira briensis]
MSPRGVASIAGRVRQGLEYARRANRPTVQEAYTDPDVPRCRPTLLLNRPKGTWLDSRSIIKSSAKQIFAYWSLKWI